MTIGKSLNLVVLIAVALIGLALSFWIAKLQQQELDKEAANTFQNNASEWVYALQQQMESASGSVRAIGDLFAASNEVDRGEFQKFVARPLQDTEALLALEWLPRISPDQVAEYLSTLQEEGFPIQSLKQIGHPDSPIPGEGFEAHFPVHFVEPMAGNEAVLATDLTTEPKRADTMRSAAVSRTFRLTPGVQLIQANNTETGLLGFWPIFAYGSRDNELHGFALGVWRLDQLVSETNSRFEEVSNGWEIIVSDITTSNQRQILFTTATGDSQPRMNTLQNFPIGGRLWQISISQPSNHGQLLSSPATKFLLIGAAFTGLLVFYVASVLNRAHTVTRLVDERTIELNAALEDLKLTAEEREQARQALAAQAAELASSNADLERFAYVASHDLKEPLRTIASYISLLKMDLQSALTEETEQFMSYIQDGAKRLQQMIDDLLSYSQIGGEELDIDDVSMNEVIQTNIDALEVLIQQNQAQINVAELPTLKGDRSLLTLLTQNLLSNAIKFRQPDKPPVVNISSERIGQNWQITVADNGLGISEDHQEHIFELFHRLHSRDDYEGTGLGLAICERIATRHGGNISVSSAPDEGSAFHITLPG